MDIAFIHHYSCRSLTWAIEVGCISNNWFPWPLNMRICFLAPTARWFLIQNNWLCTLAAHISMLIMWNLIRNYSQCQSLGKWRSDLTCSIDVISIFRINLWSTHIHIGIPVSTEGICEKLNACGLHKKKCNRERKTPGSPNTKLLV